MQSKAEQQIRALSRQIMCAAVFIVLSSVLWGCGSAAEGDADGTAPDETPNVLQLGQETSVATGARLVNTSPVAAQVRIRHDLVNNTRHVTLLSGSAELH